MRQVCKEVEVFDADKPDSATIVDLVVVIESWPSAHLNPEASRCNDGPHGIEIICRDPDDAWLVFLRWEEDADAVRLGWASRQFGVRTADQVV